MSYRLPLDISKQGTVASDGTVRLELGPQIARTDWNIKRISISNTSTELTPEVRIYVNAEMPSRLMSGTYNGLQDLNETDFILQNLEKLIIVWTGADPSSISVVLIQGQVIAA